MDYGIVFKAKLKVYIAKKLIERNIQTLKAHFHEKVVRNVENLFDSILGYFFGNISCAISLRGIDEVDFTRRFAERGGKSFSVTLLKLIDESGEKDSTIYNRANIDRRHFSKIRNDKNYKPSKETALAFAIALKLDFEKTQKFLATAGYTLGNSTLSDYIVSYFIEKQIYDVDLINKALLDNKQPLLGAGDPRKTADD